MSDLSMSTIRRYLDEMGFPDLPDDQVLSLRNDVIARLQQAEQGRDAADDKFKKNFDDGNVEELLNGDDSDEAEYEKYRQPAADDEKLGRLYSRPQQQVRNVPAETRQHGRKDNLDMDPAYSGSEESEEVPVFSKPQAYSAGRPYKHKSKDIMRQNIDYDVQPAKAERSFRTAPENTSYYQAMQVTGHTRINGLLGPHRHTLEEKKKRKSDPVSNFARYQQRWQLQGPPEERKQRCFVKRVHEQGIYNTHTARYYE